MEQCIGCLGEQIEARIDIGGTGRPLCKYCFVTGIERPRYSENEIHYGGLKVSFNPTVLKVWMTPDQGEGTPWARFVLHLTDDETATAADYISAASKDPCYDRKVGNLLLRGADVWLRLIAYVPSWVTNGTEFGLDSYDGSGRVQATAFVPFARNDIQPHRGEAERFGSLLASRAHMDPDTFLRDQRDANLREKFT